MTIREAIRAYIQEHDEAGTLNVDTIEWLYNHVADVIDDELAEAGYEMDDESLEWSKKP
jgi:metal-responsive CopG/Arc/MetJ family transcriptional regulator